MNPFDRHTNLQIINELRNSEKVSLDQYIEKVLIPLRDENSTFLESLYKDIVYLLEGLDKEGDNDLLIENGDLVSEDGDYKLTGYQTRLHDICNWLHIEILMNIQASTKNPFETISRIKNFNELFLTKFNYTPEYKQKLDKIKTSLKKERKYNYENRKTRWSKFLDADILELKPNIMGLGINVNEILNKFGKKK